MRMLDSDFVVPAIIVLIPALWWIIAWFSVGFFLKPATLADLPGITEPVSLFKPLPPLRNGEERERYADSIGSFAGQMTAGDEILILGEEKDESFWREKATGWEAGVPGLRVRVFVAPPGLQSRHTNPKINAMAELVPQASHALWWWSDADITVPPDEVALIRAEFAGSGAVLQTQAYVIPSIGRCEDWLDALFVHIELLPGLTLLSRKKEVHFACGGSLLFRRADFEERVEWDRLGAELADDYFLGQKMQPVRLGRSLMQTQSGEENISSSWLHYFRWQKTVRWCQPAGFAGLFFLQPLWLTVLAGCWGVRGLTLGGLLVLLLVLEALWVSGLFRKLQIRTPFSVFWVSPLWSLVRSATWLLCWLPVAVRWSGIKWWKSQAGSVKSGEQGVETTNGH